MPSPASTATPTPTSTPLPEPVDDVTTIGPVIAEVPIDLNISRIRSRHVHHDSCHLCVSQAPCQNAANMTAVSNVEDPPEALVNYSVDEKGHKLVYQPDKLEEPAHGPAGRLVKRLGIFAYALFFVFPLVFVAVFFAIIPLGSPNIPTFRNQWVFLFICNTAVMMAIAYLYNATFLSLIEVEQPFRTSVIPVIGVFLIEIAVMTPILLTNGVFDWLGIVSLSVLYITLFVCMYCVYYEYKDQVHSFFRRFMLLLILYIPILVGFVIAYRETSSVGQSGVSFAFAFITFVYRRIMLSKLDPFPLDVAQLLAGFWVQNLGDCTTILAFPQVDSPKVYVALFLSNSLQNVAFLGFVSDTWIYKIRPVLKTYVKEGAKGNFPIPPIPEPDESFDPLNRGHDNNTGGYRRRQFRFFFFRLSSQAVAMFMYLGISPMLRFGFNDDFTPLSFISSNEYRNSMLYAAGNLVFIALVGFFGYTYLNKMHHQTFHEINEIHRHDFLHHTWVGLNTAIITHNMILTVGIILSHYCIFSSFQGCVLGRDR